MSTIPVPSSSILYWRIRNGEAIADHEWWSFSEADQLHQVANALSHPECATTCLDLRGKGLGDEGATALAEALKLNKTVTTLDLYDNHIGIEGAAALARALKSNQTLTTWNLNRNIFGDKGAAALAEALESNKTLTTLRLFSNNVGDGGAVAIAEALKSNKKLTTLTLPYNKIGDEGAAAIAEALKSNNNTLTTLELYYNYIGIERASIEQSISRNRHLARLDPLLTQFASLQSLCEITDVLYANNDNLSIIYDLLKGRNDWLSRGVCRKRKACTDLDENH